MTTARSCDFCAAPAPEVMFDARSYLMTLGSDAPGVVHASNGAWAACRPCAALVEAGEAEPLATRALVSEERLPRATYDRLHRMLVRDYLKFFGLRTAPAQGLAEFVAACPHPSYAFGEGKTYGAAEYCVRCGELKGVG